jgi:hypothetical protein
MFLLDGLNLTQLRLPAEFLISSAAEFVSPREDFEIPNQAGRFKVAPNRRTGRWSAE